VIAAGTSKLASVPSGGAVAATGGAAGGAAAAPAEEKKEEKVEEEEDEVRGSAGATAADDWYLASRVMPGRGRTHDSLPTLHPPAAP
jgi:hypothetical protein